MDEYVREYIRAIEAYGWEGGPEFRTSIIEKANKGEKRNADWSQSRFFASLPFLNILPEKYGNILDMFEDRLGRWGAFLYSNPARNYANNVTFAVGVTGQSTYQLAALTAQGGRNRLRRICAIYRPGNTDIGEAVESEVVIRVNGTPTTDFELNHDNGEVSIDVSTGDLLSWSGYYSHWVRFDNDRLPFSIDNRSGGDYVLNGTVDLIEVNPPKSSGSSS